MKKSRLDFSFKVLIRPSWSPYLKKLARSETSRSNPRYRASNMSYFDQDYVAKISRSESVPELPEDSFCCDEILKNMRHLFECHSLAVSRISHRPKTSGLK